MTEGKKTPLYDSHVKHGGHMIEFGGWLMPVQYASIKEEHRAVRERAGLFDVSHMGEIFVEGRDALAFLQKLVTNDVSCIMSKQIEYSPMCYEDGGVVDDLLIYKYDTEQYLLVVNAANTDTDWEWMKQNSEGFHVNLKNRSNSIGQLALQGPLAQKILSRVTETPLDDIRYYRFQPEVVVAGRKVMLSRTGYTGEDGFEIYSNLDDTVYLWEKIIDVGKNDGLIPAGLGARDTLRFEAGMPLYGHELSRDINPLEAGLSMFVKLDKTDFNGKESLSIQKKAGIRHRIAGLEIIGRGVARAGYPVFINDERIGVVTTGSYAPTLNKNMALALIPKQYVKQGQTVDIEIRGKKIAAQVAAKPFYRRGGK